MIWGYFIYHETGELVRIQGSMNADTYIDILDDIAVPYMEEAFLQGYVVQQDNAPPHEAIRTIQY